MEIVGGGFLAHHLAEMADEHPDVVYLAAGVSMTSTTSTVQFERERELVASVAQRCARDGRRLVMLSSAASGMYGLGPGTAAEEAAAPTTPYCRHKLAVEAVARAACPAALVLRLTSVQGIKQSPHHLVPAMVAQARAGEVTVLRGARRDVIDVVDLVPIVRALVATGITGEVLNVASGHSVAAEDLADAVVARQEHPVRVVHRASRSGPEVSIAKLRAVVPPALTECFTAGYGLSVLRRYVAYYSTLSALDAAIAQPHGRPQPATASGDGWVRAPAGTLSNDAVGAGRPSGRPTSNPPGR